MWDYYIATGLTVICVVVLITCVFALIKNQVTFHQQNVIIEAIHAYHRYCIDHNINWKVEYRDMESYDDTFKRFWDFGYTRILPEDKFNIIKHFIEKRR